MSWRCACRGRRSRASTSCARRRGSSRKATCSIGGCRHSGQGVKTRISDDRIWLAFVVAHYLEVTGDFAVLDEPVPFLAGGPLCRRPARELSAPPPPSPRTARDAVRTLRAGARFEPGIGSHGLPLFGTGDWNDGMNRVGAAGAARASGSAGSCTRRCCVRAHRRAARRARPRRAVAQARLRACSRPSSARPGTATGIGAAISMTARRWDRSPSDECRIDSIAQSWAVISGRRRARARGARHVGGQRAAGQPQRRPGAAVHAALRSHRARSRLHQRLSARPARERRPIHACRHVVGLAFAHAGRRRPAGELFSLLNPINHASTRAGIHRYKVEPYVACADVYQPRHRTSAAAAGPGTPARPAGCIAPLLMSICMVRLRGNRPR
jgi:cyclic beta-1,2-glucan synthetase